MASKLEQAINVMGRPHTIVPTTATLTIPTGQRNARLVPAAALTVTAISADVSWGQEVVLWGTSDTAFIVLSHVAASSNLKLGGGGQRILKLHDKIVLKQMDDGNYHEMEYSTYLGAVREFVIHDDFLSQTQIEADGPWIELSGTDTTALDPTIVAAQEGGVIRLTTGNTDGVVSKDGSQILCSLPMQADSYGLFCEALLHINSAVTTVVVNFGFTDINTLQMAVSISGTTITTVAVNAVVFAYDTNQTTDEWYAVGVDGNTDATGNAITGTAPVADIFQKLRIEVAADGEYALFYIDGALVGTLTAAACAASTNLFCTVVSNATTTQSRTVDIDYIRCGHIRVLS